MEESLTTIQINKDKIDFLFDVVTLPKMYENLPFVIVIIGGIIFWSVCICCCQYCQPNNIEENVPIVTQYYTEIDQEDYKEMQECV